MFLILREFWKVLL